MTNPAEMHSVTQRNCFPHILLFREEGSIPNAKLCRMHKVIYWTLAKGCEQQSEDEEINVEQMMAVAPRPACTMPEEQQETSRP